LSVRRPSPVAEFLRTEAAGGAALLAATVVALVWANSPWSDSYHDLLGTRLTVGSGDLAVSEDLHHWVNDALMAVFFLLVGLEIKREVVDGQLSDRRTAALPALAALGGMVVPALVFLAVAAGTPHTQGWAVPMATDIAFALGVVTLLGDRAPAGMRIFILTVAVVDDIGGIIVIAAVYSDGVQPSWLAGAAGALGATVAMRRLGIGRIVAYLVPGVVAWYCTYRAGVHPTIAAVALGLLTPVVIAGRHPLATLEHRLHPWSSFVVMPVFALANAGVSLGVDNLRDAFSDRLFWAIVLGLLAGKTIGITAATWAGVRTGAGRLPDGLDRRDVPVAGAIAGIGFTVALFLADLAFADPAVQSVAKLGILAGSLASGLTGVAWAMTRQRAAG
jgi:Na+:H+ antiporter, NhaA family